MSLSGDLISIAVILVVVALFGSQLWNLFLNSVNQSALTAQTQKLLPKAQTGQTVCSLEMTLTGVLSYNANAAIPVLGTPYAGGDMTIYLGNDINYYGKTAFLSSNPTVSQAVANVISYKWENCFTQGSTSLQSILPTPFPFSFSTPQHGTQMAILGISTGTTYSVSVVLTDADGHVIDSTTYPNLTQKVSEPPSGTVLTLPYQWTKVFLIDKIPYESYNVQINSDHSINDNAIGNPYIYVVQK